MSPKPSGIERSFKHPFKQSISRELNRQMESGSLSILVKLRSSFLSDPNSPNRSGKEEISQHQEILRTSSELNRQIESGSICSNLQREVLKCFKFLSFPIDSSIVVNAEQFRNRNVTKLVVFVKSKSDAREASDFLQCFPPVPNLLLVLLLVGLMILKHRFEGAALVADIGRFHTKEHRNYLLPTLTLLVTSFKHHFDSAKPWEKMGTKILDLSMYSNRLLISSPFSNFSLSMKVEIPHSLSPSRRCPMKPFWMSSPLKLRNTSNSDPPALGEGVNGSTPSPASMFPLIRLLTFWLGENCLKSFRRT
ncbi:hypothetical protein EJ110_NYTH54680 [Nymphaea thermarum]|nr:hypothetical protein EJ110_NYTH54680 [Nymphaea thermarum]